MIFCKKCGQEIPDDAKFCPNCGTPIDVAPETPVNNDVPEQPEVTISSEQPTSTVSSEQPKATAPKKDPAAPSDVPVKKNTWLKILLPIIAVVIIVIIIVCGVACACSGSNKVNFKNIYNNELGGSSNCGSYVTLASDNSYLTIDTNPLNLDDYYSYQAWSLVQQTNAALGLPESLNEKMLQTRALDGRLSEDYDNVSVSWTYHPDKGLEVLYEKK